MEKTVLMKCICGFMKPTEGRVIVNGKIIGKYSLDMRQRLGLAQAIMENPQILILDEPMNGLDKDGVMEMRKYLLELKSHGKTIILASHLPEDIKSLCDTVCEMDHGKIVI